MKRLSLKAIGQALGVSAMSVSLAIRGRPGVSKELRDKIVAYARDQGYAPDPVAAELMSLVRSRQRPKSGETIAYITTFADPGLTEAIPAFREFLAGAKARAAGFGYRVEEFRARSQGMTGARLSKILRNRGVRGVLVGPRWRMEPDIDFAWEDFSVVLVGEAEYGPNIYRVCNHHVHSCATCLREMEARGYRRIGVQLVQADERLRGYDYLLGVDQYRRSSGEPSEVIVDLIDEFEPKRLRPWVRENRLDAVVSLHSGIWPVLEHMRTADGARLGYANLNVSSGAPWSGIDQHSEQIGGAAVDLLRALLHGGERGAAPAPRILLIDGSWVDGGTTRPRPSGTPVR